MEHTIDTFFHFLKSNVTKTLIVTINDNRSTMLSVKWEQDRTKVSLHKMFLKAPDDITRALAEYLNAGKSRLPIAIKSFIGKNLSKIDHSHLIQERLLESRGKYFDLKPIFDMINRTYFENKLDLKITWFGDWEPKSRSKISLGLYYDSLKLIKVHRVLDNPRIPLYVLEYIVYHEMLHSVCRAYIDDNGINRIHGKEYKKREELFSYYDDAKLWLKQHQKEFFASKRNVYHGRA